VKKVGTPPFFFLSKLGKFAPKKKHMFDTTLILWRIFSLFGRWVTGTKGFSTTGLGQEVKEPRKKKLAFSLYKLGLLGAYLS
jgi:hypothetical protein